MLHSELHARRAVAVAPDAIPRFWRALRCPPLADACWTWRAGNAHRTQPVLTVRGRTVAAARIAYFVVTGEWPLGHMRAPMCGNPACVRPSHSRWTLGLSTRRIMESMQLDFIEIKEPVPAALEIDAAKRAGVIDGIWA